MKIGIYGGTFNPIHNGHIYILKEFAKRLNFDKIIVIPTAIPPHKIAKNLVSSEHRYNMCSVALQDELFNFEVSKIEIQRMSKSYSVDTLRELKEIYPNDELFFIMGEDMFLTINHWYKPEEIFKMATICASQRSLDGYNKMIEHGNELRKTQKDFKFIVENIPYMEVSSTEIRENLNKMKELVPKNVVNYILENKLYGI